MKFVNDYLNDEEMKEFEKRALRYPTGNPGFIGYHPCANGTPSRRPKCTLDREAGVYLFYCGRERYDFETIPKEDYFVLIGGKILGDLIVIFTAKKEYLYDSITDMGYGILWKLTSLNLPGALKERREEIKNMIRDAMAVYGIKGDPKDNVDYVVEFGFEEVI